MPAALSSIRCVLCALVFVIVAPLSFAADTDSDGIVNTTETFATVPVLGWYNAVNNVSAAGNSISFTGAPTGWNSQINSPYMNALGVGLSYRVSWTVATNPAINYSMVGLGRTESSSSYQDIDYALYNARGRLYIYESGTYVGVYGNLAVGSVLAIEVVGTELRYLHNNAVIHTVTIGLTSGLYLDTSFYSGAMTYNNFTAEPLVVTALGLDRDGDSYDNDVDHDSDNDSIPDSIEAGLVDSDLNGVVDDVNDIDTIIEAPDTDLDGIPDYLDLESNNPDNDGTDYDIDRFHFARHDTNGDGRIDGLDAEGGVDANNNGLDDLVEDADQDGTNNTLDPDDDNDGVLDINDAFPYDPDETDDTDGDGVGDNTDVFPTDPTETEDYDGDGIGDNADIDDDNDSIPDLVESRPSQDIVDWNNATNGVSATGSSVTYAGGSTGWNSQINSARMSFYGATDDYRVSWRVVDTGNTHYAMFGLAITESSASWNDIDYAFYVAGTRIYIYESGTYRMQLTQTVIPGTVLSQEFTGGNVIYKVDGVAVRTSSAAGSPDFYIDSSWYTGVRTYDSFKVEPINGNQITGADQDGDGIPNQYDLDSDNDLIPDVVEAGLVDADNDGIVDNLADQGSVTSPPNSDGDFQPDFLDLESNNASNDGTSYDIALGDFAAYDTNGDGLINSLDAEGGTDVNNNGWDDLAEFANRDSDGDGIDDSEDPYPNDPRNSGLRAACGQPGSCLVANKPATFGGHAMKPVPGIFAPQTPPLTLP